MPSSTVSARIPLDLGKTDFSRADIEIQGVEHAGPSYEGRVFLNNPDADERTPLTAGQGYAGAFHVYGTGMLPEEPRGHRRSKAAVDPGDKVVIATDAVRRAAAAGGEATVTIVPVLVNADEWAGAMPPDGIVKYARIRVKAQR